MKYNQPYGVSDPNAPYINGNPSTGTMGSIPPAASIENPQREIVAVIQNSGLVPSDSDLSQLARGIQNGAMNYGVAGGTPNAISINLSPAPLAYTAGLAVIVLTTSTPTDQVQINLNSLGGKPIVAQDGTPVKAGAWAANYILFLVYDGTRFILVSASAMVLGGQTVLTAPRDYYVNVNTGNDANPGVDPALPFKTIQKGVTTVGLLNLNGYTATVHVADGVYPESVALPGVSINGTAVLVGNQVTFANCFINAPAGTALYTGVGNMTWFVRGFKLGSQAASGPDWGHGIWVKGAGQAVWYWNLEFGDVLGPQGCHIITTGGAQAISVGLEYGGGALRITGKASAHLAGEAGGIGSFGSQIDLTIVGNPPIGTFAFASAIGQVAQRYRSITGTCIGQRYNAMMNAIIDSGGGGANYYPGTVAGVTSLGGQYN